MNDVLRGLLVVVGQGTGALLGIIFTTGVVTVVVTKLFDKSAKRDERVREGYAAATAALVAWGEFPYRVARRTSEAPEVLAALASRGHDVQEALACQRAWVVGESRPLAELYAATVAALRPSVAAATQEAWRRSVVESGADMVLSAGPALPSVQLDAAVDTWCLALTYRFGWRRIMCVVPGILRWRLQQRGILRGHPAGHGIPTADVDLAA
jgi:hypothetical protein